MRTYSPIAALLALAMLLIPAAAAKRASADPEAEFSVTFSDKDETVKVFSSGKVSELDFDEYIKGVVAAEISPSCHPEALKAQAVAAYTYALRIKNMKNGKAESEADGADITDSPAVHQGYYDKATRKEKWGDDFGTFESRLDSAVKAVKGKYLSYDGEPILAVYHDTCCGRTQSAGALWGTPYPYLVSVASPGDKLSPSFSSQVSFTREEFEEIAASLAGEGSGGEKLLGKITQSSEGYVSQAVILGKEVSGWQVREAFGLKSNAFTVAETDGGFTFKVSGSGHGVGMSQYGADYMARQGSTYDEILFHYYPGAALES